MESNQSLASDTLHGGGYALGSIMASTFVARFALLLFVFSVLSLCIKSEHNSSRHALQENLLWTVAIGKRTRGLRSSNGRLRADRFLRAVQDPTSTGP